jgi:hypothetical protein
MSRPWRIWSRCLPIRRSSRSARPGSIIFYDKAPRDLQEQGFRRHIEAARQTACRSSFTARDADDDMIRDPRRRRQGRGPFPFIFHCFSSGRRLAEVGVELGGYVSFSGILTFKKSEELRDDRKPISDRSAARRDRRALSCAEAASWHIATSRPMSCRPPACSPRRWVSSTRLRITTDDRERPRLFSKMPRRSDRA